MRRRTASFLSWAFLLLTAGPQTTNAADLKPEDAEFFEARIRPLLIKHCYSCHSAEAKKVRGALRLDTAEGLRQGGSSGPAIEPGQPAKSLLIEAVHQKGDLRMPPEGKLSAAAIADLETWVLRGAPDPRIPTAITRPGVDLKEGGKAWAYQTVREPPLPPVRDVGWTRNPVDRFVLARLEAKGLQPVEPADRRTLLRRATYDLTGLPPTPAEVAAFLADASRDAFARVVERLLASPAYGERWGRHWLDVIRYADTAGDNSDYPIPQMYRYRNWVIDAFNRDLPYDQFIRLQLAGDLLGEGAADAIIATGYLANARRFGSYEDARYPWHLTIDDTLDNLGKTFLGLTLGCARCHDHKFDPLTAADYYALYGFFSSTRYPWPGIELDKAPHDLIPLAPPEQIATALKERKQKLAAFDAAIARLEKEKTAADKALEQAGKIADENERKARIAAAAQRVEDRIRAVKAAKKEREDFAKQPLPFEVAYAVAEGKTEGKKKVGNACIQIKGDPERLGPEVPRRFPLVLGGQVLPADAQGSGRRQLADWIADPANPLTGRVLVNRLWQYHFGKGLVSTPNDFGKQGRPPTHPELLDYLAKRFVDSGWSIKAMHRLIMRSQTYLLASRADAANAAIDVSNDYLWRYNRRRLDAESIRDTLLTVSGGLERSVGGPHPFPPQTAWSFTQHKPFKDVYDSNRRSVYLMTQRIQRHPFLALFDGPDTNASTATRETSTTPLQALYLMNDPFIHEQARRFASRLLAAPEDDAARLTRAWELLFSRTATDAEQSAAREYLGQVGEKLRSSGLPSDQQRVRAWESLARLLFLSNELVYLN